MNPALDSRARFEAHLREKWDVPPIVPASGEYADTASQDLWEAWQAAIASMAVPNTAPMYKALNAAYLVLLVINDCSHMRSFASMKALTDIEAILHATPQDPPIAALAAKETP